MPQRIIHMTPMEPGEYKALYWQNGFFNTRPVIALATYEQEDGDLRMAPVVAHGTGRIFALAGVEANDLNILLPIDPFAENFEGMHPTADIARVSDALRNTAATPGK